MYPFGACKITTIDVVQISPLLNLALPYYLCLHCIEVIKVCGGCCNTVVNANFTMYNIKSNDSQMDIEQHCNVIWTGLECGYALIGYILIPAEVHSLVEQSIVICYVKWYK